MNLRSVLSVVFLMISTCLIGQITANNNARLSDLEFFVWKNNPKYDGAEGSQYLFEYFIPAKINAIKKTYAIRFDAVDNAIEFKDQEGQTKVLSPQKDYTIMLSDGSNRLFKTKNYRNDDKNSGKSFFEELYGGEKFQIYRKERIKFQPLKPARSGYEPEVPAKFIRLNDAFYVHYSNLPSDLLIEIPRKKKRLKTFFGKEYAELEKFSKKNELHFDNADDLIVLFKKLTSYK